MVNVVGRDGQGQRHVHRRVVPTTMHIILNVFHALEAELLRVALRLLQQH